MNDVVMRPVDETRDRLVIVTSHDGSRSPEAASRPAANWRTSAHSDPRQPGDVAERVCGGEPLAPQAVAGLLADLAGRSLVQIQAGPAIRYSLLETVRRRSQTLPSTSPGPHPEGQPSAR